MNTRSYALRLAQELDAFPTAPHHKQAAAELRRLHAENESLAAALASSCDEQRHELWESGGIAGCERARVAERQRDALLEALKELMVAADGVNAGPQTWLTRARAAIKAAEENT